jgi:DNA recombination protein RmuC
VDTLTVILLVIVIISVWGLIAAVVWLALRSRSGTRSEQIAALQTEMNALREQVGQNLGTVTQHVQVFGDVQKGIGEVTEATKQILALGQNIAALQDILRAPKPRGGLGEIMLGKFTGPGAAL